MKTTHFIFPLILALTACTPSTFDPGLNTATAAQERTYADCKAQLYQAPQRIISGQMDCPNPCLYTHEGYINFAKNELMLNCQKYPLHSPSLTVCIDSTRSFKLDGSPNKQILVITKNFAAWCQDAAFRFYQQDTNAKPYYVMHIEEGDPSYGSVGYLIFQMEDAFWQSFDPAKPFLFRITAKKPLKMQGSPTGQQPL